MDDKNEKKPSSKKRRKPAKLKKQAKPEIDNHQPFSGNLASLSALFAANQSQVNKEGEGIKCMSQNMQEYLSNYILIGYTMDGNPVHVTYAPTPKDYDCLNTGLQRYIMEQGPPHFGPGHM